MSAEPSPAVMRRLWQVMSDIYLHKWVSAVGADASGSAGQTWAKGLSGLTPTQIGAGIEAAIASSDEWPPSLPAFRALCFAIPSLAVIRSEIADRNAKRSPFARLTWSKIDDHHRYRLADADKSDRILRDAYETAREHVMRGNSLPEPLLEIEAPEPVDRKPAPPEVAAAHLAKMADALRLVDIEPESSSGEMRLDGAA